MGRTPRLTGNLVEPAGTVDVVGCDLDMSGVKSRNHTSCRVYTLSSGRLW